MKMKFNAYVQKVVGYFSKGKKSEKLKMCIALLLIGVILCIAGKGLGKKDSEVKESADSNKMAVADSEDTLGKDAESETELEWRLEEILGAINGVGEIKVLITYEDEGERIPMENTNEKSSQNVESGTTDKSSETDIITEDNGDGESVAVRRQTYPSIRGVIVVAEGASDAGLRSELIAAVAAVTGVSQHKIRVMSM